MEKKYFEIIAQNIADWIYWVRPDGKVEFHSKSVEEITGYSIDEVSKNENFIFDIIVDEDKSKVYEHFLINHQPNYETSQLEFRIKSKNGDIKTISHICRPIYKDGTYIGRLADNRDVTLQKQQEEIICSDKERFDLYVNKIKDIIWDVDNDYKIRFISPSIEEIVGLRCNDLIGKNILELLKIHPDSETGQFLKTRRQRYLEENFLEDVLFEFPYLKDSGEIVWFEVYSNPIFKNGVLDGFIGIARNISKRVSYRKKLETIMNIIDNSIWEYDLSAQKLTISDKFYRMLGYEPNEFEPTFENILSLIHPEHKEIVHNILTQILKEKSGHFSIEYKIKTKSDNWKWLNCKGLVTDWDRNGNALRLLGVHIDIDAQKRQAEEKLNLLASAIRATTESVVIADVRGNIEYVNPAFMELTGYSYEEAMGKNPRDLVKSGEQSRDFYIKMWKAIANGKTWKSEIINRKKDGTKYVEFLTITPVKNENGKITHYIAIKRDITYERELLRELNKTNAELQAIYDSSPLMITLLDREARVVYANKTTTDFIGLSLDEIIGKRACGCFGCVNNTDNDPCGNSIGCKECKLNNAILQTFATKQSLTNIEHEAKFRINDEIKEFVFFATTSYVKSDGSEYVLLNMLDVTEKKKAEQKLAENLTMFRNYVEAAPIGIVAIDSDGIIKGCNKAFSELIKDEESNIKNKNILDFVFQYKEKLQKVLENCIKNNSSTEIILENSQDEIFWARVNAVLLNSDEILLFVEDIDKKKRFEEEQRALFDALREANDRLENALNDKNKLIKELEASKIKLQETINAKDKFFSIISHDLRGPFSGFLGLTDMMAKDLEDLSVRELKEMSQAIYNSANSVYKLLDDLLQWSRLQLGKIPFYPEKIAFVEIVKNSIFTLKELAQEKEIDININLPNDLILCCDRNMITGVIRNLVSNSIKFTKPGGWIKIYSKQVDENFVEISVEDNGIGIPEDIHDKLFRIDTHVTTLGTEKETGSGLGLILCKEFVEKHQGKIYFTTKINEGTKFSFTLPLDCKQLNNQ